jgi:hypothetical protein
MGFLLFGWTRNRRKQTRNSETRPAASLRSIGRFRRRMGWWIGVSDTYRGKRRKGGRCANNLA